jgi:hypothetical protein
MAAGGVITSDVSGTLASDCAAAKLQAIVGGRGFLSSGGSIELDLEIRFCKKLEFQS